MAAGRMVFVLFLLQFCITVSLTEEEDGGEDPLVSPPTTTMTEFRADLVSDIEGMETGSGDWTMDGSVDTQDSEPPVNKLSTNETEQVEVNDTVKQPRWNCANQELSENIPERTLLVNSSELLTWINVSRINSTAGACCLVLFYADFCHFSAELAAAYNAMGRLFTNLPVLAIDAYYQSNLNARFGVVGVPTILLFYNGKPVLKFNQTRSVETMVEFLKNNTGLETDQEVVISSEDYEGPLLSYPISRTDYYLWFSVLFLLSLSCWIFSSSRYWTMFWNSIPNIDIAWLFQRDKQD